jgi:hypothetical protein
MDSLRNIGKEREMNPIRTALKVDAEWPSGEKTDRPTAKNSVLEGGRAKALSVSLLIATKNRADELALAMRSVLRQTELPAEIIILDQSPTDRGRTVIQWEFAASPSDAARGIP